MGMREQMESGGGAGEVGFPHLGITGTGKVKLTGEG